MRNEGEASNERPGVESPASVQAPARLELRAPQGDAAPPPHPEGQRERRSARPGPSAPIKSRLLRYLRRHAVDGVIAVPKEQIARDLGCALRPLQRAVRSLLDEGRIRIGERGGGRGRVTRYMLAGAPVRSEGGEVDETPPRDRPEATVKTAVSLNSVFPWLGSIQADPSPREEAVARRAAVSSPAAPRQAVQRATVPSPEPTGVGGEWPPAVVGRFFPTRWIHDGGWRYRCFALDYEMGSIQGARNPDGSLGSRERMGMFPKEGTPEQLVAELERIRSSR